MPGSQRPPLDRSRGPLLLVGLTGGIGCGKSAAAAAFRRRGVPVLDADEVARDVVAPGQPALAAIAERFGQAVIAADGALDRARLRGLVFSDTKARADLEAITHPAVRARFVAWLHAQDAPYAIYEVPLLFETGLEADVDRVLVIDVPEAVQIARVVARDGGSEAAARRVLNAQVGRTTRLARADDVIDNSGTRDALDAAVDSLHRAYLADASARRAALRPRA